MLINFFIAYILIMCDTAAAVSHHLLYCIVQMICFC